MNIKNTCTIGTGIFLWQQAQKFQQKRHFFPGLPGKMGKDRAKLGIR